MADYKIDVISIHHKNILSIVTLLLIPVNGSVPLEVLCCDVVWSGTYLPEPVKGSAPPDIPVPPTALGTYLPPPEILESYQVKLKVLYSDLILQRWKKAKILKSRVAKRPSLTTRGYRCHLRPPEALG